MIQFLAEELEPAELLPEGALLHRRYVIDGVLGRGTYGITYFGHDEKTGTPIALKEYFPYALAERMEGSYTLTPKNKACGALFFLGSEMFYRQHLALTDAKGSENCVTVYTAFFENGTSYAVMERLTGVSIQSEGIATCPREGWTSVVASDPKLSPAELREIARAAGVHIYSDTDEPLYASRRHVALHSATGGARRIALPRVCGTVTELFSGRLVGRNVSEIEDDLPTPSTVLYDLGEA